MALDDLTDTDTSTNPPVIGDALVFDGTDWIPAVGQVTVPGTRNCGARINSSGGSAQNVTSTANTQVTNLATTVWDSDGFITTPNQITIPVGMAAKLNAGRWELRYGITSTGVTAGSGFAVQAQHNGSSQGSVHFTAGYTTPGGHSVSRTSPVTLADGDAITLAVLSQDSAYTVPASSLVYLEIFVHTGPATESVIPVVWT
jgi:hypothetical protein